MTYKNRGAAPKARVCHLPDIALLFYFFTEYFGPILIRRHRGEYSRGTAGYFWAGNIIPPSAETYGHITVIFHRLHYKVDVD